MKVLFLLLLILRINKLYILINKKKLLERILISMTINMTLRL